MAKIEDEFRDAGLVRGKTLYLRPSDAIAFVRRCRQQQVKIFGLDAVHITPETTKPDMNESIDLSVQARQGEDCWLLAEEFLDERLDSGLYFEVVADE